MMLLRLAINAATLISIISRGVRTTPIIEESGGLLQSPLAISTEGLIIDHHVILKPVHSCLSKVILVIYVQSLPLLKRLDMFKDMYDPFFAELQFYVDGTWCDPRDPGRDNYIPCYGPPLNRSALPEEVHVLDHTGGGWFMQRALIDAIQRSHGMADPAGFLFITDDVLLNLGKLTREGKCDVIWRAGSGLCQDVENERIYKGVIKRFLSEARKFFQFSEQGFKEQLARNLGSPSMCCMGEQPDFLYIPGGIARAWTKIAQQMTDVGLTFPFTFNTAIYGLAPKEDMLFLQTHYLDKKDRADNLLTGAMFEGNRQPYCWTGEGDVNKLIDMHIIHPNKVSYSNKSWDFALTLNQPWSVVNISASNLGSLDGGAHAAAKSTTSYSFWCGKH